MIKIKTIAKVKCFGSPTRQRDALVTLFFYPFFHFEEQEGVIYRFKGRATKITWVYLHLSDGEWGDEANYK